MITKSAPVDAAANVDKKPLSETGWQEWLANNRADEIRGGERHMALMQWLAIALFLTVAVFWTLIEPYQRPISFVVALLAFVMTFRALRAHRYIFAFVFATMVVVYNPLFPTFTASGQWERIAVVASITPFLASLVWLKRSSSIPIPLKHAN